MVVFVPSDSYLTAYDDIRRLYRHHWKPVQVFCSNSVDTVASWCLLQTLFQEDLIMYELHIVNSENDIHDVLCSQDVFSVDMEGLPVIFLNCGSSVDLSQLVKSDNCPLIHILDGHGPVSLELLMLPEAANVYIWDAGNTQAYIERFLQSVKEERKGESKHGDKRQRRSARGAEGTRKETKTLDHLQSSINTEPTADVLSSIGLTPEERLAYFSISCKYETPSFFLFSILAQLHIRVDDEVIWDRTIALTDFFSQDIPGSSEYDQRMKRLHETVLLNQRSRSMYRTVNAPDVEGVDNDESNTVGSYHSTQIENIIDLPLVLLHHWTLWDAFRHSASISRSLRLFDGQALCKQRILDMFAFLGITHKEAKAKWIELPASRRAEIQKLLLSEGVINNKALCASFHTISKRHGYGYICGAVDMVRLLQHILSDKPPQTETKKVIGAKYDIQTDRANFFTAIEILRSKKMSDIVPRMAKCCSFYTKIVEIAEGAHLKRAIKSTKTFDYLLLQDTDLPVYYLNPITLRVLSQYLVSLPTQRTSQKSLTMFITGTLDRNADEYILVGTELREENGEEAWSSSNIVSFLFRKLSIKYHEIVRHNGIDRDVVRVQRAHALHLLDAVHIELLRMPRGSH